MLHFSSGVGHVAGQQVDRFHRLQNLLAPALRRVVRLLRGFGGSHRVTRHFIHCRGHLIDSCCGLFDFMVLLMQATRRIFGNGVELLSRRSELIG